MISYKLLRSQALSFVYLGTVKLRLEGGQVIVDLRVVWLSGVWSEVHQRYLASKPMPDTQADMVTGTQHEQQAA